MHFPYLQRTGIGLHIGHREVRWVELVRSFSGLPFERLRLRHYETEPVVGGAQEAALRRLVERIQPRDRYVHTHVDPEHVRVRFLDIPGFDDEEDVRAWLAEQPQQLLPAGSDASAFVLRSVVVARGEEGRRDEQGGRGLITVVRKEAVEERAAMIERAGLIPIRVGTGLVEVPSAFVFDPEYEESDPILVYVEEPEAVALRVRDAMPLEISVLDGTAPGDTLPSRLIDEVEARLGMPFNRRDGHRGDVSGRGMDVGSEVWLAGSLLGETSYEAGAGRGVDAGGRRGMRLIRPLSGALDESVLGYEATLGSALAVEALYPRLPLIDLQDEAQSASFFVLSRKEEAQRALLGIGTLVLALLLVVQGTTWGLQRQIEATELQLLERAETLAALTAERRAVEGRRRDVRAGRELVGRRTAVAQAMEAVGRSVPVEVSLSAMSVTADEGEQLTAKLSGWATTPGGVQELIARLETNDRLSSVRLLESERYGPADAERLTEQRRELTGFTLSVGFKGN